MKIVLLVVGIVVLVLLVAAIVMARRSSLTARPAKEGPARDVAALVDPLRRSAALIRQSEREVTSYLGGRPPMHAGFTWPTKGERPLGFLGCIDLSEVSGIEWLPRSGRLLFFYDIEEQPWGFDPKDRGGWAVLYVPEQEFIEGLAAPPDALSVESILPRCSVAFHPKALAPSWDHPAVEGLDLSDAEEEALIDLREADYEGAPRHQIGAFPDPIQSAEMELECQLASHGLYLGDGKGHADPRAKDLQPGSADWRLLLQVDSDDSLNVMWGDVGMLYFWVREEDARRADFSGTWLVLQCH